MASLAIPAAAAALAYLNARGAVSADLHLAHAAASAAARLAIRAATGRLNQFYVLEHVAKTYPDRTFLICAGRRYSYCAAYERILRYGHWLSTTHHVQQGQVVALDMANSDVFVFAWFGLWSIGAKPAFINHNLTGQALVHCIRASGTALVLADADLVPVFSDEVRASLDGVVVVGTDPQVISSIQATDAVRHPDSERAEPGRGVPSMAILIYTSGTTGLPKPAIVSWGKAIIISILVTQWINRRPDDILYTSMPLYHSSATLIGLLSSLEAGGAIAIGRKFSTRLFWDEVRASDATIVQYVGETCRYLLSAPPQMDPKTGECLDRRHKVRLIVGNGLRPDVWTKFKDRFGIETVAEFYTATEAMMATFNLSSNDFSAGAIGRTGWLYSLIMRMCIAIIDVDFETDEPRRGANGRCRQVANGTPGELIFRVPFVDLSAVFQGYYGNPDATRKKTARNVFRKGDVWFRTGDVVRQDADGLLFFLDRIGDTFRWKGENVSTAEVAAVVGNVPGVLEANVYGVELPNHDGRIGCAAIVLEGEEKGTKEEETLRNLAQHITALPSYARPVFLRIMAGLEDQTTGTNKQQKHVLRSEGVRPVGDGRMFWLRGGAYVPFGDADWASLSGGGAKL